MSDTGAFRSYDNGDREEISPSGFRFWRRGKLVVSIGATESLVTGTIKTALSGRRREFGPNGMVETDE